MCCFFWVVNASRNEKSCLQFLIPTAVFHMRLRQRETHLVCLSCSAESATKALFFALHSVPRVFYFALMELNGLGGILSMSPKNFKSFHTFFAEKQRVECKKITCLATRGRGLLPRNLETHARKSWVTEI